MVGVLKTGDGGLAQPRATSELALGHAGAFACPAARELDRQLRRYRHLKETPAVLRTDLLRFWRRFSQREVSFEPSRPAPLGCAAMSSPGWVRCGVRAAPKRGPPAG